MANKRTNIVIVGGGFAGVRTALDLVSRAQSDNLSDHRIVLVDRNSFHLFTPWLYERASTADISRTQLQIPYSSIFQGKSVEVIRGEVVAIKREQQTIRLQSDQVIPYEVLVLACGSVSNDFNIPGIHNFSLPLKTIEDADTIRTTTAQRFRDFIDKHEKGDVFQVLIGGGGPTGVELAAQLHSYLKEIAHSAARDEGTFLIKILDASTSLLGGMSDWTAQQAQQRLGSYRRIEILLQHQIQRLNATSAVTKSGDKLAFDVFIWTGGVQANPLIEMAQLENTLCGRATVSLTLQSPTDQKVFVVGDSSLCTNPKTNKPSLTTIESAYRQGALAARNIHHLLQGESLDHFEHVSHGYIVPLKTNWAISMIYNIPLRGRIAYLLMLIINARYLLSILPPVDALRRWLR